MVKEVFRDVPHVELLQWLARGSLKQNLLRAIRLSSLLRILYPEKQEQLSLDDGFSYAEWRDGFFTSSHPKGEAIPALHDGNCPCAKTAAEWLFNPKTGISEAEWKKSLLSHAGIDKTKLNELLQQRLFGVTRRCMQGEFKTLAELGWLKYVNQKYYLVSEFPMRPVSSSDKLNTARLQAYELGFLPDDISAMPLATIFDGIAENHSVKINGIQRFFVHLDYVIPKNTIDSVENWQWELKEVWAQTPVPPIKLTYYSARVGNIVDCIVFPVCIYYVQRAVYLCAMGESPDRKTNWYNFRLDRIQAIIPCEWNHPKIPLSLQQCYRQPPLPSPDYIVLEMSKAWGFDFYLPSTLMLLRFDRDFSDRYIKDTERHDTFEEITYQKAQRVIERYITQSGQKQNLPDVISNCSPDDAYYQVFIRYQDSKHRDNNVIMRLRAWRPRCEVLLPFDLRQSIAEDVAAEYQLYHTVPTSP